MNRWIYRLSKKIFRTSGNDIDYDEMQKMLRNNKNIVVLDVRARDEYMYNHLQGAINIPLQEVNEKIVRYVKDKNEIIIVYCQYGGRSKKACGKLEKLGYQNVYNLDGGIEGI